MPFSSGNTPWNKGKSVPQLVGNTNGFKKGFIPWNKGLDFGGMSGKKHSDVTKQRMSERKLGNTNCGKGSLHWNWKKDRNLVKKYDRRNDPAYKAWRSEVYKRDNWKCKVSNADCYGRIEAHHILGWSAFPELRYNINNGITLCHYHHPRKRDDEERLAPTFNKLVVGQMNDFAITIFYEH
jgi:hypothetical protein